MIGQAVDSDQVEHQVDQHQHQDEDVEEDHHLASSCLDEALLKTPGTNRERQEPRKIGISSTPKGSAQCAAGIQLDESHPSKHGEMLAK